MSYINVLTVQSSSVHPFHILLHLVWAQLSESETFVISR